jgi:hypothetical protein
MVAIDARDRPTEAFRSHANYIRAFATLAGFGVTMISPRRGLARLAARAADFPVPGGSRGDARQVVACLQRAWGTELLLNVVRRFATEEELLRLANSWGAVQTYYAAYGATQALIVAEGRSRPPSHPSTQKQFVDMWVHRGAALAPWSFAFGPTSGAQADAQGYTNGPGRPLDHSIHAWSACTETACWDLAAVALRSTRQHAIDENLRQKRKDKLKLRQREWRQEEEFRRRTGKRPRQEPLWPGQATLTAGETAQVRDRVRPYTVLDYLYRLRIKANYEDPRMFTDGPEHSGDSSAVAGDLVGLTAATMVVHEVRIANLIGAKRLLREAEGWLGRNSPPGDPMGLAARLSILQATL